MGNYLPNRVLKLNVGFLLNTGPGHSQDFELDVPTVKLSDDLVLSYVRGPVRLSRTKEGILIQADLHAGAQDECYRCLEPVKRDMTIEIEELYGVNEQVDSDFVIHDDGILDLGELLRAEVLINSAHRVLCRQDCKGLCPECGANRNEGNCDCEQEMIDPRLAELKKLLNRN